MFFLPKFNKICNIYKWLFLVEFLVHYHNVIYYARCQFNSRAINKHSGQMNCKLINKYLYGAVQDIF